jgi:hypothetical protein
MIRITGTALVAAALISAGSVLAGSKTDQGCCAKGASHSEKVACADFSSLNLTADQKTKLETWQAECVKAGCTKQSQKTFLKQAKGILSPDQYAKLKKQCEGAKGAKKTEA